MYRVPKIFDLVFNTKSDLIAILDLYPKTVKCLGKLISRCFAFNLFQIVIERWIHDLANFKPGTV